MRSTSSGSAGQSPGGTGWQYSALVRGQVPEVRNTNPSPSGTHMRYGSRESGSGLAAMSSSTVNECAPNHSKLAGAWETAETVSGAISMQVLHAARHLKLGSVTASRASSGTLPGG